MAAKVEAQILAILYTCNIAGISTVEQWKGRIGLRSNNRSQRETSISLNHQVGHVPEAEEFSAQSIRSRYPILRESLSCYAKSPKGETLERKRDANLDAPWGGTSSASGRASFKDISTSKLSGIYLLREAPQARNPHLQLPLMHLLAGMAMRLCK